MRCSTQFILKTIDNENMLISKGHPIDIDMNIAHTYDVCTLWSAYIEILYSELHAVEMTSCLLGSGSRWC